jgi:periplasmic mercuric ion binding protein
MNFKKSMIVLAVVSLIAVSCKKECDEKAKCEKEKCEKKAEVTKKAIAPENLQTASFTVTGMSCPEGCAKMIESKLSATEGVQEAKVDFDKKLATISFDKTVQNQDKITQLVEGLAGSDVYKVSDFK